MWRSEVLVNQLMYRSSSWREKKRNMSEEEINERRLYGINRDDLKNRNEGRIPRRKWRRTLKLVELDDINEAYRDAWEEFFDHENYTNVRTFHVHFDKPPNKNIDLRILVAKYIKKNSLPLGSRYFLSQEKFDELCDRIERVANPKDAKNVEMFKEKYLRLSRTDFYQQAETEEERRKEIEEREKAEAERNAQLEAQTRAQQEAVGAAEEDVEPDAGAVAQAEAEPEAISPAAQLEAIATQAEPEAAATEAEPEAIPAAAQLEAAPTQAESEAAATEADATAIAQRAGAAATGVRPGASEPGGSQAGGAWEDYTPHVGKCGCGRTILKDVRLFGPYANTTWDVCSKCLEDGIAEAEVCKDCWVIVDGKHYCRTHAAMLNMAGETVPDAGETVIDIQEGETLVEMGGTQIDEYIQPGSTQLDR